MDVPDGLLVFSGGTLRPAPATASCSPCTRCIWMCTRERRPSILPHFVLFLLHLCSIFPSIVRVTNEQYRGYLSETGYTPPVSDQNWLKHWPLGPAGGTPAGWEDKPVIWVSRNDATAYCAHFGKRLPHTWEWQWAAQGQLVDSDTGDKKFYSNHSSSSRRSLDEAPPPPPPGDYPWCRVGTPCDDDPTRYPPRSNNGEQPPPANIGEFPTGACKSTNDQPANPCCHEHFLTDCLRLQPPLVYKT